MMANVYKLKRLLQWLQPLQFTTFCSDDDDDVSVVLDAAVECEAFIHCC